MNDTFHADPTRLIVATGVAILALAGIYGLWRKYSTRISNFQEIPVDAMPEFAFPFMPIMDHGTERVFVVRLVGPAGEILDVPFSEEEWFMINQVVEMSGDPIEKVVIDIILERKENETR